MIKYVYILRSIKYPKQHDVGLTSDVRRRLKKHNVGSSAYTKQFVPWKLDACVAFVDERKARAIEKYLKHGSRHAF